MKARFVSDIHINGIDDPRLKTFESFLRTCLDDGTTHVFLVGDIFDLWVGDNVFFQTRYATVIERVRALRAAKIDVIYFEGNHDLHLEKFWSENLHCRVVREPQYFDLAGLRVRVEHGDQMNPDDTGYLILRTILRTRFIEWLAYGLPGSLLQKIGERMSRSSRRWTASTLKALDDVAIKKMVRRHAEWVFKNDEPFDLIVSGHVHVRDDVTLGIEKNGGDFSTPKTFRSVNLGCWSVDEPPLIFTLDADGGRWE